MHKNSLRDSLTSPFWGTLTKKNETLSELVARRRFSNKIGQLEEMYKAIWSAALLEPKNVAGLAAYFDFVFVEMAAEIKKCEDLLSDIKADIKYFMKQFSNDKKISEKLVEVTADINKTPEHMKIQYKKLTGQALLECNEIKKFRVLLIECRKAADEFAEAMKNLGESPSFDTLEPALVSGDNYRQNVVMLYNYKTGEYFPYRTIFHALLKTCLQCRPGDHWVNGFSRYSANCRDQWGPEIAKMRAATRAAGGDAVGDADIIRVMTGAAVKNVAIVKAFGCGVHEVWQKSFVY